VITEVDFELFEKLINEIKYVSFKKEEYYFAMIVVEQ
jgi:hypothetical protein